MKFKSLLFVALCALSFVSEAQVIKISEARAKPLGTVVTVRGIAVNGAELGTTIRYLQDSTGTLSAFYAVATQPTFATVRRWDSIEVTGTLKEFSGLLEIDPIASFRIINSGNSPITPLSITPAEMTEVNECRLVKLLNGTFTGATTPTFVGNTTYKFAVNGVNVDVRLATGSALAGKTIPSVAVNLVGICSQFNTAYQLLPRDSADIEYQSIAITSPVKVADLSTTGFAVNWETNIAGSTEIQYGTTTNLGTTQTVGSDIKLHTITIANQTPSKLLYVRTVSRVNGKADSSRIFPVILASLSSGETRVYFNHSVDTTFKVGNNKTLSTTGARYESETIAYINAAKSSVDVAMYNNGSSAIVDALKAAAARGVRVRYVADNQSSNTVLTDTASLGFKVCLGQR